MSKNIYATTLRLNLDNPADRAAWEHLQRLDRVQYRSVSRAVVAAVNTFFDRHTEINFQITEKVVYCRHGQNNTHRLL